MSTFAITLKNMQFSGFSSSLLNGSALSFEGADSVILENVYFTGNKGQYGGAVYISGHNHTDSPTAAPSSSYPSAAPSNQTRATPVSLPSVSFPSSPSATFPSTPSATFPSAPSASFPSAPSALVPSASPPTATAASTTVCKAYSISGNQYATCGPFYSCPYTNISISGCGSCTGNQKLEIFVPIFSNTTSFYNITGGCGATSTCAALT